MGHEGPPRVVPTFPSDRAGAAARAAALGSAVSHGSRGAGSKTGLVCCGTCRPCFPPCEETCPSPCLRWGRRASRAGGMGAWGKGMLQREQPTQGVCGLGPSLAEHVSS